MALHPHRYPDAGCYPLTIERPPYISPPPSRLDVALRMDESGELWRRQAREDGARPRSTPPHLHGRKLAGERDCECRTAMQFSVPLRSLAALTPFT